MDIDKPLDSYASSSSLINRNKNNNINNIYKPLSQSCSSSSLRISDSEFNSYINRLNPNGLALVVKIIQNFSPKALVELDSERWMVKTNFMDDQTYSKILG